MCYLNDLEIRFYSSYNIKHSDDSHNLLIIHFCFTSLVLLLFMNVDIVWSITYDVLSDDILKGKWSCLGFGAINVGEGWLPMAL